MPYKDRTSFSDIHERACRENGAAGYGPVESDFLYCFVRRYTPKRIIQIGAGVSTSIILRATSEQGIKCDVTCIDPFPTSYLQKLAREKRISLLSQRAQDVDMSEMTKLSAGDLLFVDSTHAVRPGGEVNWIILELLPRLPSGIWVHFHDIMFPYDYQPSLMDDALFFPVESTLLHAFLIGNPSYCIRTSLSMLHVISPDDLAATLARYRGADREEGLAVRMSDDVHWPSAIYLQSM
jgi:hypothetical protein